MLKTVVLVLQFVVVASLAGGSVWLGQGWRNEGKEFFQEQEKQGGIEKTKLVLGAEAEKAKIIENYEAEAREEKGRIEGRAIALSKTILATGHRDREETENQGSKSQGYALTAIDGIDAIADQLERSQYSASGQEASAYKTIVDYLRRAAKAQAQLLEISLAPRFDCSQGPAKAVQIASALVNDIRGSPVRVGETNLDVLRGGKDSAPRRSLFAPSESEGGKMFKKRY